MRDVGSNRSEVRSRSTNAGNEFIAGFVGTSFHEGRIASIDEKTRDTVIHTEYGKIEITLEQDDI